jgi:hypothetical protein
MLSLKRPRPSMLMGNSVHAQHIDEVITGELTALVGVEDIRSSLAQGVLQRLDAEA